MGRRARWRSTRKRVAFAPTTTTTMTTIEPDGAPLLLPESARAGGRGRFKPSPLLSGEGSTSSAAVAFDRIDFEGGEAQLRAEVSARPSSPTKHLPAIFESPVC